MTLGSDEFWVAGGDLPLQQGDVLLAPVARVACDTASPPHWQPLDEDEATLLAEGEVPVSVAGGMALVMVTTHDCGLDKEFNARLRQLEATGTEVTDEVIADVEGDDRLDRHLQVSPLVAADLIQVADVQPPIEQLMAGKMVGYVPVPALHHGGRQLVPEAVVDLHYRATVDRNAHIARVSSISELARTRLRYALARLDALRTPTLELELASIVGKVVTRARVAKKNPLAVELAFDDGTKVQLLQQPGSPAGPGPARTARSAPRRNEA